VRLQPRHQRLQTAVRCAQTFEFRLKLANTLVQ
jgi:hypothetical protein